MKANRTMRDRAEVGVGTLIVFIAMVLVAAVAAAVLINTSGELQQRAQATGKDATQEVSSNLKVIGIYGVRNTTADDVWDLKLNVELSAGAQDMDLTKLILRYSDGNTTRMYAYHASAPSATGAAGATTFTPNFIRGDGSGDVMAPGDLVELHFNLYSTTLSERKSAAIDLIPETGSPVKADFRTPSTYSNDLSISLR